MDTKTLIKITQMAYQQGGPKSGLKSATAFAKKNGATIADVKIGFSRTAGTDEKKQQFILQAPANELRFHLYGFAAGKGGNMLRVRCISFQ